MRTTVTLDPDVEQLIKRAMRARGLTLKQAVNDASAGLTPRAEVAFVPPATYDMGDPAVDVTKALRLAGELEDQELAARLARGN